MRQPGPERLAQQRVVPAVAGEDVVAAGAREQHLIPCLRASWLMKSALIGAGSPAFVQVEHHLG